MKSQGFHFTDLKDAIYLVILVLLYEKVVGFSILKHFRFSKVEGGAQPPQRFKKGASAPPAHPHFYSTGRRLAIKISSRGERMIRFSAVDITD